MSKSAEKQWEEAIREEIERAKAAIAARDEIDYVYQEETLNMRESFPDKARLVEQAFKDLNASPISGLATAFQQVAERFPDYAFQLSQIFLKKPKELGVGNRTPEEYYAFFSMDWEETKKTFQQMMQGDEFIVAIKECFFRDTKDPTAKLELLGSVIMLSLWSEVKRLKEGVKGGGWKLRDNNLIAMLERLAGGDDPMVSGVINIVSDKLQEWEDSVIQVTRMPDKEIRKGMIRLRTEMRETRETLESMRDLLAQRRKADASQLQTTIDNPSELDRTDRVLVNGVQGREDHGGKDSDSTGKTEFVRDDHGGGS